MLKKMFCILFFFPVLALASDFVEGKDYQVISKGSAIAQTEPTVTEFFSYGCPWCYKMETPLNEWAGKQGKSVQMERVPVVFRPVWELYAKAYYTASSLALSDKFNSLLFNAIQDKKQTLGSNQSMVDFFVANGVDKETAKSAFESSPTIELQVKQGMALMAKYQVNAVPAFVVNKTYKTDLQMAGSPERLFKIMDFLIKKQA